MPEIEPGKLKDITNWVFREQIVSAEGLPLHDKLLHQAQKHGVIILAAPPGSGKTALINSFVLEYLRHTGYLSKAYIEYFDSNLEGKKANLMSPNELAAMGRRTARKVIVRYIKNLYHHRNETIFLEQPGIGLIKNGIATANYILNYLKFGLPEEEYPIFLNQGLTLEELIFATSGSLNAQNLFLFGFAAEPQITQSAYLVREGVRQFGPTKNLKSKILARFGIDMGDEFDDDQNSSLELYRLFHLMAPPEVILSSRIQGIIAANEYILWQGQGEFDAWLADGGYMFEEITARSQPSPLYLTQLAGITQTVIASELFYYQHLFHISGFSRENYETGVNLYKKPTPKEPLTYMNRFGKNRRDQEAPGNPLIHQD